MPQPSLKPAIFALLPPHRATRQDCLRIAAELGCRVGLVSNYASLAGLLKPRPFMLPPTDELIELLESGVRPAAITKAAGTTRSSIYRRLDRAGYRLQGGVVTLKVAA